eukprot:scaffold421618_cov114-Attheya_sp.AAC.1
MVKHGIGNGHKEVANRLRVKGSGDKYHEFCSSLASSLSNDARRMVERAYARDFEMLLNPDVPPKMRIWRSSVNDDWPRNPVLEDDAPLTSEGPEPVFPKECVGKKAECIQIWTVINDDYDLRQKYNPMLKSVECYAKSHGYGYRTLDPEVL